MVAEVNASLTLLGAAISSGSFDDELRVCAAAHLCAWGLVGYEVLGKCHPEKRAPLEESWLRTVKTYFGCAAKALTDESFAKVIARVVGVKLLEQKETEEDEEGLLECHHGVVGGLVVQQIPETVLVPILRTKMARRVPINILCIYVGACHQHSLYNAEVATN